MTAPADKATGGPPTPAPAPTPTPAVTEADVLLTKYEVACLVNRCTRHVRRAVSLGILPVARIRHDSACGAKLYASSTVLAWQANGCPASDPRRRRKQTTPAAAECPCGCGRPLSMIRAAA